MNFSSDINYLFGDLPAATFSFENLSAELRNDIYSTYIVDALSAPKAKEGIQVVKINENGELKCPQITSVSRQLRHETRGYIFEALSKPDTRIEAQIRDYDPTPLLRSLEEISRQIGVDRKDLIKRTKVRFVGELNFGNLLQWVQGNINDAEAYPIFAHDKVSISGYGEVSLFEGTISVKKFVESYVLCSQAQHSSSAWNSMARDFLEEIEQWGLNILPRLQNPNKEALAMAVFETIATWHNLIKKSGDGKMKREIIADTQEIFRMAEMMYHLELQCDRIP